MTIYYVTISGNNANDGLTESTAWATITYAATKIQTGDTVNIKSGTYINEHVVITISGTSTNPIVFQGYGVSNPVLDGQDATATGGTGIFINSTPINKINYIILKNIDIINYYNGLYTGVRRGTPQTSYSEYLTIDNINVNTVLHYGIWIGQVSYSTISNCIVTDAGENGITLAQSHYNLMQNCTSVGIREGPDIVGYHIVLTYSHDNILQNCSALLTPTINYIAYGHGIGIKDDPTGGTDYYDTHSYNNKFIDCISIGPYEAFMAAHQANNNEFIKCVADIRGFNYSWHHGLVVRDGAYNNTFKNCKTSGFLHGIASNRTGEYSPGSPPNKNNRFVNCTILDSFYGIKLKYSENNVFENIDFVNNTQSGYLFKIEETLIDNRINNSIIVNFLNFVNTYISPIPTFTYSDFWNNNFTTPTGTGNINVNPEFADLTNKDFHLKSQYGRWDGITWVNDVITSPCIQAGDPSSDNSLSIWGRIIEMGAYGNTAESSNYPTCPIPICNINITQQ